MGPSQCLRLDLSSRIDRKTQALSFPLLRSGGGVPVAASRDDGCKRRLCVYHNGTILLVVDHIEEISLIL